MELNKPAPVARRRETQFAWGQPAARAPMRHEHETCRQRKNTHTHHREEEQGSNSRLGQAQDIPFTWFWRGDRSHFVFILLKRSCIIREVFRIGLNFSPNHPQSSKSSDAPRTPAASCRPTTLESCPSFDGAHPMRRMRVSSNLNLQKGLVSAGEECATTLPQVDEFRKTSMDTRKGMAGPEGIEPSTFGCPSAVKSFSLAPARPLLYLSRAYLLD